MTDKKRKKIGFVTYWFNRGQGTVSRYIRSIFDSEGFETAVLARPTKDGFFLPRFIDERDVWSQEAVTKSSSYEVPIKEYLTWIKQERPDVVFFDQNYDFDSIFKIKALGVKTIGRFVWESFAEKDVQPAKKAFSVIYSLTKCEQERYKSLGIDSPLLRWGCHPEILAEEIKRKRDAITFFYPAGYLSARKPTGAVIKAFEGLKAPSIRLIIKTQRPLRKADTIIPQKGEDIRKKRSLMLRQQGEADADELLTDERIEVVTGDFSTKAYYELMKSCHVCVCPSRWEGLGLHFYEALGLKLPIVANDIPPINEAVTHNVNGLLVKSFAVGKAKSGITAYEPDVEDLRSAMEEIIAAPSRNRMAQAAEELSRTKFSWANTVHDFRKVIDL